VEEVKQHDEQRQKQLEAQGLAFLRFTNNKIKLHSEEVIRQIEAYLQSKIKL
jgi:very-short-patch-repair endonuclease